MSTAFMAMGIIGLLVSCSGDKSGGSVNVQMLTAAPGHCQYQIVPKQLDTLDSVNEMRGRLGQVVYTNEILTDAFLEERTGFSPVDLRFVYSGGVYTPLDYPSLYAASLYGSLESVYKAFAAQSTFADMTTLVPNLSETYLVYQAKLEGKRELLTDNGMYTNVEVDTGAGVAIYNYILALPSSEVTDVPLPINPFIVSHEAAHMVNHFLWRDLFTAKDASSSKVLGALDEGFSDYIGFIVTNDPSGFLCTFPDEDRDLSVPKTLSAIGYSTSDSQFPIHAGGAVWASAQYRIGSEIGHGNNLKALIEAFRSVSKSGAVTFSRVNQAHVQALGSLGSTASSVYGQAFGGRQ